MLASCFKGFPLGFAPVRDSTRLAVNLKPCFNARLSFKATHAVDLQGRFSQPKLLRPSFEHIALTVICGHGAGGDVVADAFEQRTFFAAGRGELDQRLQELMKQRVAA